MNPNDFKNLMGIFLAEIGEFLQLMEANLLAIETANEIERKTAIKELFRAAHSVKGSAAMMGFNQLSVAAHELEDCFAIVRDQADLSTFPPALISQLLEGVDQLRSFTQEVTQNPATGGESILTFMTQLKTDLEAAYHTTQTPVAIPVSPSAPSETIRLIFEHEFPPVLAQLETAIAHITESDLAETLKIFNQIYYQLSAVAGMLGLPALSQIIEPLKTLPETPDLTLETLKIQGEILVQNLRVAREKVLQGQPLDVPQRPVDSLPKPTSLPAAYAPSPLESPLQRPSIRVDLERLTELVNLVGELVINRTNLELQESELRSEVRRIRRSILDLNHFGSHLREEYDRLSILEVGSIPANPPKKSSSLDALEMDRYGEFHSVAQQVIETTETIAQSAGHLDGLAIKFEQSTDRLRRITEQLRSRVMQLRVVNFGRAVDHLPRALREMCLTYNKEVNLLLLGRDTKIDESLLEALREPLIHLVRNAFDHGIEMPEARQAVGKPASGQIEIEARHQGGQTIITVSDDGRGIDLESIRQKVVEKGLMTEEQAQDLSINELYDTLFLPGFSTTETVTDLSGRGVGLDVVRAKLRSVRGTIKVDSRPGKGTSFILKLPLLLSIAEALLVRTDHNTVAVPLDAVEEILYIQGHQIQVAGNQSMLAWREEFIRLVRLQELLKYNTPQTDIPSPNPLAQDYIPVLVLATSEGILAVVVERLLGQQEIVVKPLPAPLSKPKGILGSTILGDGRVVNILDVDDLGTSEASVNGIVQKGPAVPPPSSHSPQILVVDDSYTIRQLLQLTLTSARYRVMLAKDGLDALEKLQNGLDCHLVIADIEMPRMDGFELLRSLKSIPPLATIPVAMLTSRSGVKHRQMALELGACEYFTKPYSEVQLLEAVAKLIEQNSVQSGT